MPIRKFIFFIPLMNVVHERVPWPEQTKQFTARRPTALFMMHIFIGMPEMMLQLRPGVIEDREEVS
jgi:hypothetical protein